MAGLSSQIALICAEESSEDRIYQRAVEAISGIGPPYDWVGIYQVEGDELLLVSWLGPHATEHVRIPLSQGICGLAATEGQTVVVDDVSKDPRYLACFVNTRSEMVVPIRSAGVVVAEIDIDSDVVAAFTDHDRQSIESAAEAIGTRIANLRSRVS